MERISIVIRQGATFKKKVRLFSDDRKTVPLDLTGKTIRSSLIASGVKVASFSCAPVGDLADGEFIWLMSKATTAVQLPWIQYRATVDVEVDGDGESFPAILAEVTVEEG